MKAQKRSYEDYCVNGDDIGEYTGDWYAVAACIFEGFSGDLLFLAFRLRRLYNYMCYAVAMCIFTSFFRFFILFFTTRFC